jgi:hypothetical protein
MLFFALVALSPLAYYQMPDSPSQDLATHVAGIVEANNALAEGQFPIRIAPNQNDKARYPIFQYYGNLPYTAGALICRFAHSDPYEAWKLVVLLSLTLGGFFTYRASRLLTRQTLPSLVAGAVFLTAPYLLTDIHGRFAYSEIVSFCLLPVVFYFCTRSFLSSRVAPVLGSAIAWSALGLSHNITFLYGSLFFAAYFCSYVRFERRFLWGILRVGAGYGLGLVLNAWYLAPQSATLHLLAIADQEWSVFGQNWLTPLSVLLAPSLVLPTPYPVPLENPHFGLQCGWPILAAAGLACYYASGGLPLSMRQRGWLVRPLVLLAVALFLVWSPLDFWQALPRIFSYVQFSYRLLMFVVLWGALLAGSVLAHTCRKGLPAVAFLASLGVLGLLAGPYLGVPHGHTDRVSVAGEVRAPNMGRWAANEVYRIGAKGPIDTLRPLVGTENAGTLVPAAKSRAAMSFGNVSVCRYRAVTPCLLQLPIHYYPGLLSVRDNGAVVPYGSLDGWLALQVPPGDHAIEVRYVGCEWANRLSAGGWFAILAGLLVTLVVPMATASARVLRPWTLLPGLPLPLHVASVIGGGCAALVGVGWLLHATVFAPPLIRSITASSVLSPLCEAEYAIDGKELTAWAAASGEPATLQLQLRRAVPLHSLELLSRGTNLYEGWHNVTVRLYHDDKLVLEQPFSFPDAATRRLEIASFSPTLTNHIELLLSQPVLQSPWGKPADRPVHPGYAEIRLGYQ